MTLHALTIPPVVVLTAAMSVGIAVTAAAQSNPVQIENAKPGSTDWLLTKVVRHDDEVYELGWRRRRGIEAYASHTSVTASQRTREIGIRMALGATRSRVVAGVLSHAGALVVAGCVGGGLAAWWLSNLAGRFLFGLDPRDPRAYGVAMATLVAAAVVATALPARRAAGVNPIDALRNE